MNSIPHRQRNTLDLPLNTPLPLAFDLQRYKPVAGIYKIHNVHTDAAYIGMSRDIKDRWLNHRHLLGRGLHKSNLLQNEYIEFGIENLQFIVLELCQTYQELRQREFQWIKESRLTHRGLYNHAENDGSATLEQIAISAEGFDRLAIIANRLEYGDCSAEEQVSLSLLLREIIGDRRTINNR